ncbi:MAG: aldo/keto reductase [Victivallales bacterium]|nr:aldo/keto reductase [Victivallales bacterium]MCF7888518.1 aldo/keto reductase [Victivallales bacterium]
MKYRRFGKTDIMLSALGFGTMRLPTVDNQYGKINEPEAIQMIRYAIDKGVNYIDTAYMYHEGNSEGLVARALNNGYREKVYIADKLALWGCENYDDLTKVFETQLNRLHTDCIDFYLVHCLQEKFWKQKDKLKLLEWCDNIRKSGKIKYLGFSFHDSVSTFKEIVDGYNWDFCQIQYNYMNEDVQAGTEGLKYAADKGLPVMIMEPLLGGMLTNLTRKTAKLWDSAGLDPVETALQWLWNKPEVTVVLSGMSSLKQVKDNIKYAENSGVGILNKHHFETVKKSVTSIQKNLKIPCTKCQYCMSECPNQIPIPDIIEAYNLYETNKGLYPMLYSQLPEENNASACMQCKKCEEKCPQNIKISEFMPEIHKRLSR